MRDTDLYQRILGLGKPWFVKGWICKLLKTVWIYG